MTDLFDKMMNRTGHELEIKRLTRQRNLWRVAAVTLFLLRLYEAIAA